MTNVVDTTVATVATVAYGKVVRVTSLKRDQSYAQKRWIEQQKGSKAGVRVSKWVVTKVTFLGASWHGQGQWLKDGELPMLKVSDGLNYYFDVGGEVVVAQVQDRCLFLGNNRLTFGELTGTQAATPDGTVLAIEYDPNAVEQGVVHIEMRRAKKK